MMGGGDNAGGGGGGLAGLVQAVFAQLQPVLVQGVVQNLQGLQPNVFGPNGLMQQHIEQLQAQNNLVPAQPPPAVPAPPAAPAPEAQAAQELMAQIPGIQQPGPELAPEPVPEPALAAGSAAAGDDLVAALAGAPHGDPAPDPFQPDLAAAAAAVAVAPDEAGLDEAMDVLAGNGEEEEAEDQDLLPELVDSSDELSEELEFPWPEPQGDEMMPDAAPVDDAPEMAGRNPMNVVLDMDNGLAGFAAGIQGWAAAAAAAGPDEGGAAGTLPTGSICQVQECDVCHIYNRICTIPCHQLILWL